MEVIIEVGQVFLDQGGNNAAEIWMEEEGVNVVSNPSTRIARKHADKKRDPRIFDTMLG